MPPMWTRLLICIFHFAPTIAFFAASTVMRGRTAKSSVYTDKIIEEMAAEAEVRTGKGKIRAVYFGGGTPTALLTEDLVRLIRACYQYLPLAEDCEFTIEGRMSHFDLEKAQACLEAGANRISIGVQTFNTAIRRRLGRKHSGDEAFDI